MAASVFMRQPTQGDEMMTSGNIELIDNPSRLASRLGCGQSTPRQRTLHLLGKLTALLDKVEGLDPGRERSHAPQPVRKQVSKRVAIVPVSRR